MDNLKPLKPITVKKLLALVTFIGCLIVAMMILADKGVGDVSAGGVFALVVQFLSILYIGLTTIVKTPPDEVQKLNDENEVLKKRIEQAELQSKLDSFELIDKQKKVNQGF